MFPGLWATEIELHKTDALSTSPVMGPIFHSRLSSLSIQAESFSFIFANGTTFRQYYL